MPILGEEQEVGMALAPSPEECDRCTPEKWCFGHKARTLVFGSPRSKTTREFRHPTEGYRIKQTKDDATRRGNITTEHAKGDRQDVVVRPDGLEYGLGKK
jgi:hypothetical protein